MSGEKIIQIGIKIDAGVAGLGEVGEWKDKLITRNPGWNDVLHKASKSPGSRVEKINK